MGFVATLTAALKAIPEIVGLIRDIRDGIGKLRDSVDQSKFEKFKIEIDTITEKLKHAKSKEETAAIIRELNNIKRK